MPEFIDATVRRVAVSTLINMKHPAFRISRRHRLGHGRGFLPEALAIPVVQLPTWYDVNHAEMLQLLIGELFAGVS